jgi:uncharacterized membrane-anchored protein
MTLTKAMIIVAISSALIAGFQAYFMQKKARRDAENKAYRNKAYKSTKGKR